MQMMGGIEEIRNKLESFKKRFYIRQLIAGILLFIIINGLYFLIASSLEHSFWLSSTGRAILFFGLVSLLGSTLYHFIIKPILNLIALRKGISDEEAAKIITEHFTEIEDRLINTLQLSKQNKNELLEAAISKKSREFSGISFTQAVDFRPAKKYAIGLLILAFIFTLVSFISPSLLSDSSKRIVDFRTTYTPDAPFSFIVDNQTLTGFRGEDFTLKVDVKGNQLPERVDINSNGKIVSTFKLENASFEYAFKNLQSEKEVQFSAAGFSSQKYRITVNDRPELVSMLIRVKEPNYTGGKRRTYENTGNLTLLEGSSVLWELNTLASDSIQFLINTEKKTSSRSNENVFSIEERVFQSGSYQINLFNEFSQNKSELIYGIDVIKDQYPEIVATYFPDSVTYRTISFAGSISDDYGFSGLRINYRKNPNQKFTVIPLEINKQLRSQSYFATWNLDTLNIKTGEKIEVYISVLDNDGIRGPKETKAGTFILKAPTDEEIESLISDKQEGVENQLESTEKKAEEIAERLETIEDRLKSEQKFDWQEKKLLNDVIEDREKLSEEIKQLEQKHQDLLKSSNQFQKQSNQIQEKNQKLQELINELLDEETQKLYEKLKELMKQNSSTDQISQELENLKKNERNLERDLERALELFKRLKMESALEQNLQSLDTLGNQQEELANEDKLDSEAQEKLNEQFEEFREKMNEVEEMNQELKRPEALEDFELEERQIAKELREIMEEMNKQAQEKKSENGEKDPGDGEEKEQQEGSGEQQPQDSQQKQDQKPSNIKQKQQNAAEKMNNLSKKLQKMQGGMQMEMMQANLDQLRDILDNLIKLSFNQEEIMLEMREVNQSDPRFLELSQNQLKLKDDAKVIQDSLLSLAEKVVQISSFVTREVESINDNIDEAIDYLKDRNRGRALSSQQFAMTSINNLALLLDDTMQQMQMSMSEAMGNSSQGEQNKPQGLPDLQELQNQLGEKMNELKGSGKSGRELSEELAKLAAEQEMIRRQMEMLKEAQDGKPGGGLGGDELKQAIDMMEQNEVDLVNKRLTRQLINRQKQIQTRMLEAEKAQRDQETEEEREAQQPGVISREMPPEFKKYLELKKKEIELLKTIPIELNPFYKKEVNDYFRRLSSEDIE